MSYIERQTICATISDLVDKLVYMGEIALVVLGVAQRREVLFLAVQTFQLLLLASLHGVIELLSGELRREVVYPVQANKLGAVALWCLL